ncbi:MAG: response regulator [Flavobacteriales bacterium]
MNTSIWMLENDNDDRYITETTFRELAIDVPLHFFSYSDELLSALEHDKPSIIIISSNSVPLNGIEVLQKVKTHPEHNTIPVVILSEISSAKLISECYRAGANSYVVKPPTPALTKQKIKAFFRLLVYRGRSALKINCINIVCTYN